MSSRYRTDVHSYSRAYHNPQLPIASSYFCFRLFLESLGQDVTAGRFVVQSLSFFPVDIPTTMASSSASSSAGPQSLRSRPDSLDNHGAEPDDVPLEVLVEHLLHAKRSLSSITLVLRANELATHARQLQLEAVVQSAQTAFLRSSIKEQTGILNRLRDGLLQTYEWSDADFKELLRQLDASGDRLAKTMETLRQTPVDAVFRPLGEEQKTLLDFINEEDVESRIEAVKGHMMELQVQSLRFARIGIYSEC